TASEGSGPNHDEKPEKLTTNTPCSSLSDQPSANRKIMTESTLDPARARLDQVVEAGDGFTQVVRKGETFRIVDLEGNQAVDTLFYNAADPVERYSAVDTIRNQGNIYLTTGTE